MTGLAAHVCYFFFRTGTEMESATAAVCALLHQLFSQNVDPLKRHGIPQYQRNGTKLANLFEPLWEMFMDVCRDPDRDEIIFIVDALDECDTLHRIDIVTRLAEVVADKNSKVNAKFLVTSRLDTSIRNAFFTVLGPHSFTQIQDENEEEAGVLAQEINIVTANNIDQFRKTREALEIYDNVHEELRTKAFEVRNRTYLWVSIVFSELQNKLGASKEDLIKVFQNLPEKAEKAYEGCLARIPPAETDNAKKILRIIVAAARDLTLEELKIAFTIARDGSYQQLNAHDSTSVRIFKETIRQLCGLLIRMEGSVVSLIHQTAREFLTKSCQERHVPNSRWHDSFDSISTNRVLNPMLRLVS